MVTGSLRVPNALEERKSRAKIGFRAVERVRHDLNIVVLRGRRIKSEAHVEIGVLLRGNLNGESVRFEGRDNDDFVYRRIRIVFGGLWGIKRCEGVGSLE